MFQCECRWYATKSDLLDTPCNQLPTPTCSGTSHPRLPFCFTHYLGTGHPTRLHFPPCRSCSFTGFEIGGTTPARITPAHPFEEESEPWNDQEWFHNRLQVLLAQDTFLYAADALVASYQALQEASREENGNLQVACAECRRSLPEGPGLS